MAINLKEILISDVDNIKLDKVNYNFDQLVANGGGPQGLQGNPGDTGYQGVTGYQGNQGITGDIGETGNQGSNGQLIWKINTGSGLLADTILPIIDSNGNAPSVFNSKLLLKLECRFITSCDLCSILEYSLSVVL